MWLASVWINVDYMFFDLFLSETKLKYFDGCLHKDQKTSWLLGRLWTAPLQWSFEVYGSAGHVKGSQLEPRLIQWDLQA